MATLYDGKMAAIYDAMYQSFVDYDEEYDFYNAFIQENNCKTRLEIGSGTGNLAKRFKEHGHDHIGLDYSQSIISIAQERNENCIFIQGGMRNFNLDKQVDALIITGRSTSYLTTNEDVNETFASLFNNLTPEGTIVFDFIDANLFIPYINENQKIIHQAESEGISYIRESHWETTTLDNFMVE
jgi:ubiquinone/menaquinone biosynthesis C-methylase UbiE